MKHNYVAKLDIAHGSTVTGRRTFLQAMKWVAEQLKCEESSLRVLVSYESKSKWYVYNGEDAMRRDLSTGSRSRFDATIEHQGDA